MTDMQQNEESVVSVPQGDEPEHGWSTKVSIVRVLDGDTVEVEIRRRFLVRLQHPNDEGLIYDTPEKDTPEGLAMTNLVRKACHGSKWNAYCGDYSDDATLYVAAGQDINLLDQTTFKRVIGALWVAGVRLTNIGLNTGMGRLIKKRKRKTTPWPWDLT